MKNSDFVNKNSTYMKTWTMKNLPNLNYWVTDIDLFIRSITGCCMFIEIKSRNAKLPTHQKISYEFLDHMATCANNGYFYSATLNRDIQITYFGKHVLTFENTSFANGKAYWNGEEITEQELIDILSFKADCVECFRS